MDTSAYAISPSELAARVGRADAPLVLDVRRDERFARSSHLLPCALRCAPQDIASIATTHAPQEVVVYCVYGHEVSQNAAAQLRAAGWNARFLAGGIEGGQDGSDTPTAIADWRRSGLPRLRKRSDLGVDGIGRSRWMTRERPKIDRIACPWLVRRFIDPRAEFFYVPTAEVFSQAQALQAVPYDIPDAPITHVGELCSFDALLDAFGLNTPALERLALIVRGADTARLELATQSAGLLALSLGLSALHANDHAMLEAAMPLYDALYAWCHDAQGEAHTWRPA